MGIKLLLRARNRLVSLRENWYKVSNDALLPGLRVLFQRLLCWQVWQSEATRPAWIAHKTFSPHKIMALRRKGADCTSSSFLERQVPTTVVEGKLQVKLMSYTRGNSKQATQVRALVKGKLNLFYIGANCQSYLTTDCVEWGTEPTSQQYEARCFERIPLDRRNRTTMGRQILLQSFNAAWAHTHNNNFRTINFIKR